MYQGTQWYSFTENSIHRAIQRELGGDMKVEELVQVLKSAKVEILHEDEFGTLDDKLDLNRDLYFRVGDIEYYINWFHNLMKLYTVGTTGFTMFTRIEHSGTWPNSYMRNLQMYYGDNCVSVIGLEKYPQ